MLSAGCFTLLCLQEAAPASPSALAALLHKPHRAKQESLLEARRAEEEAAAAAADAEAAEAARRKGAAGALRSMLASKAASLPPEPVAGEGSTIQVVVRLPDGTRCGRRFRLSDPLRAAFDFVDVTICGDGGGSDERMEEIAHREGGLRPGGDRLVTPVPRCVYEEGRGGSLADAGITRDTALFVEVL